MHSSKFKGPFSVNVLYSHSERMLLNLFFPHHHQPTPTRSSFKCFGCSIDNIFKMTYSNIF